MAQVLTMQHRFGFRLAVGLSSTLGLLVMVSPAGIADYIPPPPRNPLGGPHTIGGTHAYTPPPNVQGPRGDHTGGGSRSGDGCSDGDITALAPRLSAIGQTTSTHPTLVWHSTSENAEQIELHLYKYSADNTLEQVFIRPLGASQPGYMSYTLPDSDPGLSQGITYMWQVVMYCDQALQEVGKYTSAEIEVVPLPAELATATAANPLERAQQYGQAGLWYDAMALVYGATTPEEEAFRRDLLLNLAELEAQTPQEAAANLSAQLRQIAAGL